MTGIENVNRVARPDQALSAHFDLYRLRTILDITPVGDPTQNSQMRFDFLIYTLSRFANPVVISPVTTTVETLPISDLPGAGGGPGNATVYTFYVAFEREWVFPGNDPTEFLIALDDIGSAAGYATPYDFNYDLSGANENVSFARIFNIK